LTVSENRKGVIDIDTTKGCYYGMMKYPNGGCYGECYAKKIADLYGYDFGVSVSRRLLDREHTATVRRMLNKIYCGWYRIGTLGDPSHDWDNVITVCKAISYTGKIPVIVTKHWVRLSDAQIEKLKKLKAVFNTSTSGLDTDDEIKYRVSELMRLRSFGLKSVCRIVTCKFGKTIFGNECNEKQEYLLSLHPIIDNPLRLSKTNHLLLNGHILAQKRSESVGGGKLVSLNSERAFLGSCRFCIDKCGVDTEYEYKNNIGGYMKQEKLFNDKIEFVHFESVIGSGYEKDVAKLALEDGIAHRAARKNMQIHSAIVLKINEEFAGFFTFQNNHEVKEFCLLQSVIKPEKYTDELYKQMALEVLKKNTNNYPALMTTNPKSKFETPKLYESLGFQTYLEMSGFCYMLKGCFDDARIKILAHITMTNVWDSTKGKWLELKRKWKSRIEEVGEKMNIANPMYATRDGCWQGTSGFANVVAGKSHNGNASVLDTVACEVIVRFFMPISGNKIYNPFGGGVQFGFVAGHYGYNYTASEIRKNQCDANNSLCSEFDNVKWVQGDSSKYIPDGMYDLIFTCPPYYKVEKYIDYDGCSPNGEINSMSTYEEFRDSLFRGYKIAIDHLNDNRFFVVMTGDSRDKNGAYYCHEAETEIFLKENGLSIYNRIVYLEGEFTRLAQAKKTLNMRKFPKREQKIIVAYKGDISKIKDLYIPIGRL
jgi:hypothetical protein